jgi:hypothetical protein
MKTQKKHMRKILPVLVFSMCGCLSATQKTMTAITVATTASLDQIYDIREEIWSRLAVVATVMAVMVF